MITLRKKYIYDDDKGHPELPPKLINIELDRKDYGVSFGDLIGECNIEGHDIKAHGRGFKDEYIQKCAACGMARDIKVLCDGGTYLGANFVPHWFDQSIECGDWYEHECYECEENCIVNRPMNSFKCPNCHRAHGVDIYDIDGLVHSGANETLLFDCGFCHEKDQIIA